MPRIKKIEKSKEEIEQLRRELNIPEFAGIKPPSFTEHQQILDISIPTRTTRKRKFTAQTPAPIEVSQDNIVISITVCTEKRPLPASIPHSVDLQPANTPSTSSFSRAPRLATFSISPSSTSATSLQPKRAARRRPKKASASGRRKPRSLAKAPSLPTANASKSVKRKKILPPANDIIPARDYITSSYVHPLSSPKNSRISKNGSTFEKTDTSSPAGNISARKCYRPSPAASPPIQSLPYSTSFIDVDAIASPVGPACSSVANYNEGQRKSTCGGHTMTVGRVQRLENINLHSVSGADGNYGVNSNQFSHDTV